MLITGLVLIIIAMICSLLVWRDHVKCLLSENEELAFDLELARSNYRKDLQNKATESDSFRTSWLSARANSMKLSDEVSLLKCKLLAADNDAKFWQNEHNSIRNRLIDIAYFNSEEST